MPQTYGRQLLSPVIGIPITVLFNLDDVLWKAGGVTIDWTTVVAASADTTYLDGNIVKSGYKALRYGQVLCRITATGLFGPFQSTASDGRQTLARESAFILNETVLESGPLIGMLTGPTSHPGVFYGGLVWRDRLLLSGVASAPLATPAGAPTLTAVSGTSPGAGAWTVGYTFTTATGETGLSPTAAVTVNGSQDVHVAAIAVPVGATGVNYYMSSAVGNTTNLLYAGTSATGAAQDFTVAPTGAAAPTYNSTGDMPAEAAFLTAFPAIHYARN